MTEWTHLPAHVLPLVARSENSVLLQTSRFDAANQKSLLFRDPARILVASRLDELSQMFREIEQALAAGFHVAGYLSYECGYHFERVGEIIPSKQPLPLAWFGVYRDPLVFLHQPILHDQSAESTSEPSLVRVAESVELNISEPDYRSRIERIQQYIQAGDTYQVNFTDSVSLPMAVSPEAAYATLVTQQPVSYGAFLNIAGDSILSLSPELFFRIEAGQITTRPMKGTMQRGLDAEEDAAAALHLRTDEKNRAEHLMIVDLLRNDLGRICTMGSVQVDDLFSVERYRTLLQMTSTVSGTLRPALTYYEIFKALFPSGSITGAPKIRTMQIILELEQKPRGIYTGAIGYISPDGNATFNVAIRTLVIKDTEARMGVGSGIVADSDAGEEYHECKLKAAFITRSHVTFQLIETMLWQGSLSHLSMHLDRLEASAGYFDVPFDREAIISELSKTTERLRVLDNHRVRLLLDQSGKITIAATPLADSSSAGRVCLSARRTCSTDVFLRHKTTQRSLYDEEYRRASAEGFEDVLFLNERGELTEGAISNVFIERAGKLFTPALQCGVLPGVFRHHLLDTSPSAKECVLSLPDLLAADAIFLANSLRGLRRVTLA
ncbi:MAG: aminodeoxychorismate synthase component I [Acidobacteriota bacterium]|nr:aminodeoxychorismate synthase component I [Acidobacteriota bacterium]